MVRHVLWRANSAEAVRPALCYGGMSQLGDALVQQVTEEEVEKLETASEVRAANKTESTSLISPSCAPLPKAEEACAAKQEVDVSPPSRLRAPSLKEVCPFESFC